MISKKRKFKKIISIALLALFLFTGCTQNIMSEAVASEATVINLANGKTSVTGLGAEVNGNVVTITTAGEFVIKGELSNGQLVVNADKNDKVYIVLDGVTIKNDTTAAVNLLKADKVTITLADGSVNTFSDAESYAEDDEANAAINSKVDLTINGDGKLIVNGNFKHGINTRDDLVIKSGTIEVNAKEDGIRGKDSVTVKDGNITIIAGSDGIKSNNDEDEGKGSIIIDNGIFNIKAGNDGIQAETELTINDGSFDIVSGGGSEQNTKVRTNGFPGGGERPPIENRINGQTPPQKGQMPKEPPVNNQVSNNNQKQFDQERIISQESAVENSESYKGIKAGGLLTVNGGKFVIDSNDDAIHSNEEIEINSGVFSINTGDDAIHADNIVTINGGEIEIKSSYEGVEGSKIFINDGEISITASDDGINASGETGSHKITITGGNIYINSGADGIDSNGDLLVEGGTIVIDGSVLEMESAIDYDGNGAINGGKIIALGSLGRNSQAFGSDSTQNFVFISFTNLEKAGSKITLKDENGKTILEHTALKNFQTVVLSDPSIELGKTYALYVDDVEKIKVTIKGSVTSLTETGEEFNSTGFGGRGRVK